MPLPESYKSLGKKELQSYFWGVQARVIYLRNKKKGEIKIKKRFGKSLPSLFNTVTIFRVGRVFGNAVCVLGRRKEESYSCIAYNDGGKFT